MKRALFLFCCLVAANSLFAQSNDLPAREAFTLKIPVDENNFYKMEVNSSAIVLPDNSVQMYPGETLFLEVELDKKYKIQSIRSVKENLHPEKTLVISFTQDSEGKIHKGMMLKIENPFSKNLEYKAKIFLMTQNKWVATNVYPVLAKISAFETWPDVIVTIALSDWMFK